MSKLAPIERGRVEGVRSIALVRANALGDFIFMLPALEALRRAYPGARISLLAKTWHGRTFAFRISSGRMVVRS